MTYLPLHRYAAPLRTTGLASNAPAGRTALPVIIPGARVDHLGGTYIDIRPAPYSKSLGCVHYYPTGAPLWVEAPNAADPGSTSAATRARLEKDATAMLRRLTTANPETFARTTATAHIPDLIHARAEAMASDGATGRVICDALCIALVDAEAYRERYLYRESTADARACRRVKYEQERERAGLAYGMGSGGAR